MSTQCGQTMAIFCALSSPVLGPGSVNGPSICPLSHPSQNSEYQPCLHSSLLFPKSQQSQGPLDSISSNSPVCPLPRCPPIPVTLHHVTESQQRSLSGHPDSCLRLHVLLRRQNNEVANLIMQKTLLKPLTALRIKDKQQL